MDVEQLEKPVADVKISAPNLPQRNAKINSLTGLRFIAACLVFMRHTPFSLYLPVFVQSFISSGYIGVTLFFTLSGFVLCYNYYDAFSTRFALTLKPFFVARFARVYPLHFLTFLFVFSALPILPQLQHFVPILTQITLTQAWSTDPSISSPYNSVSWSVSVEAFLYLCFPLLVLLLLKRATKIRHLCLVGFVAFSTIFLVASWVSIHGITLIASFYWLYAFPVTRLGDFILGCVAARIYVIHISKPISPREQMLGVTLLVLSITAVLIVIESPNTLFPYKLDSGFSLFFAFIIYTLARYVTPISRFLSTKLLVRLGEASYAFYLLHLLILFGGLTQPFLSAQFGGDLYIVIEFLLTVLVSLGMYTYVETPLRKAILQLFASKTCAPSSGSPVPTAVS